jgi:dihydroorotate dehydrogenase (fumarate)
MDLTTKYLGMQLRTPLVASASPLSQEIGGIRQLGRCGRVGRCALFPVRRTTAQGGSRARTPSQRRHRELRRVRHLLSPLQRIPHRTRAVSESHSQSQEAAVDIPIIASLNGSTLGGWAKYAKQVEQAGADAIECNVYSIPTNTEVLGSEVEKRTMPTFSAK